MYFKNPQLLKLLIFLFFSSFISAQTISIDPSKTKTFISEVYKGVEADLGYDNPESIEQFENRLKRVEIFLSDAVLSEKMFLLSQVPLITTYNSNLKYDLGENFDPENFNPFKYKLDFFRSDVTVQYRVDGTNYIIQILP